MKNSDMTIYPIPNMQASELEYHDIVSGLTKREYFAGLAMQGLCADPNMPGIVNAAEIAVEMADALLQQLQATEGGD